MLHTPHEEGQKFPGPELRGPLLGECRGERGALLAAGCPAARGGVLGVTLTRHVRLSVGSVCLLTGGRPLPWW